MNNQIIASLVIGVIGACMISVMIAWDSGFRSGSCTELCRPAKFDSAQHVNGGCLCIGSDKVLRIKEAP